MIAPAISFTAYVKCQPQGSGKALVFNGRARITSANPKLRSYRSEVTREAMHAAAGLGFEDVVAAKHVPVALELNFYFLRPPSAPKTRVHMVVTPDADKLVRATCDSLTGVLYHDDAQVVEIRARKHYGAQEKVEVAMYLVGQV